VRQGYFPDQPHRSTHVQVEGNTGHLVLVTSGPHGPSEEAVAIPRTQAEALLDLAAGQVDYLSISLTIGPQAAALQRFSTPGPLDLITITFGQAKLARRFRPPAWFGPEVTSDPAYQARSLALVGLPPAPEVEITNAALDSLLDALDGLVDARPSQPAAPLTSSEPISDAAPEPEHDSLTIEDSVIRELARSLRPHHRAQQSE
jgi:CYTH domain-containing protein